MSLPGVLLVNEGFYPAASSQAVVQAFTRTDAHASQQDGTDTTLFGG